MNNLININKSKKTQIVHIKDLFHHNKDRADYVLRELSKNLGFTQVSESLIQIQVFQNQLFVLNYCSELSTSIPEKFMFSEKGILNIFLPTLYETHNKTATITKKLMIPYSPDLNVQNIVEIPVKLEVYELRKGMTFGDYKMYHKFFTADKIMGNQNVPDELENLILKSMLNIPENKSTLIDISRSTIPEYRRKIKNAWLKLDKYKFQESEEVLKNFNVFEGIGILFSKNSENKKTA